MNFIEIIKNLENRIGILERRARITFLKIAEDGTFILPTSTANPTSPTQGQVYFNTTDSKVYVYNGATWDSLT